MNVDIARDSNSGPIWIPQRRTWGLTDLLALAVWTAAIIFFFRDAVFLRKALFYFDISEINYPYRDFLAREIKLGRFSKWMPGLYCGFPLYSESQAGYWHPLKYLLYPWLETWKAFNLDTILSIWLTGVATYGWLRRHVGPEGALTGAGLFGLSGFVWAHLIHTSMTNALISVPITIWALEVAWETGRLRWIGLGTVALACQVFAGHLQDTILTAGIVGLYALHHACTETNKNARFRAISFAVLLIVVGMMLSAVQWVPSKELLDRSPRAEGLTWEQLTYGSWSPELLPTLVIREAYGTRARDTDWPDGYYPYHEMNAYLGLIGLILALIGAAAAKDRWVSFWIILAIIGGLMMLGKYTFLFDYMNKFPVLGSSRIPVRYHLWVSLAVAALASVGVDRLSRPGVVRLRGPWIVAAILVVLSMIILARVYQPVWNSADRWTRRYHEDRFRWLGVELSLALARTSILVVAAWLVMRLAAKSAHINRRRLSAILPVLVIADLLGSHAADVPLIDPSYWTNPPLSVDRIMSDPERNRVFGVAEKSSGEPGYASESIDFFAVRDVLGWSLPPVWGLSSATGETPLYSRRLLRFHDHIKPGSGRFDLEGVTHLLAGQPYTLLDPHPQKVGSAYIHINKTALPRVRLVGRPEYVLNEAEAVAALDRLGVEARQKLIVEDPDRPLPRNAEPVGTTLITADDPEHVEVETRSNDASYLFLADTFDPGWSATIDGKPAPIRPAYLAFRAVFLPPGSHQVVFNYRPAGLTQGLCISCLGLISLLICLFWPPPTARLETEHQLLNWPSHWPWITGLIVSVIVITSAVSWQPGKPVAIHSRWQTGFHTFTWGAGLEAIPSTRNAIGR